MPALTAETETSVRPEMPIEELPVLMTVTEVSRYLRVTRKTLRNWERRGLLAVHRVHRLASPRIRREEVARLFDARCT